ncbi:hypothetical protein, partial [Lacisediminihabitans profunda]|uniref:hypothetical protein n=1 Tax=Lacisediminihabitans profunda TaxID=2594790 RepID=UPI001C9D4E41
STPTYSCHITCSYVKQEATKKLLFFHLYIEPHPPTNLSAVIQCKQGYKIQIDWQVNTREINISFVWRKP